MAPDAAPDAPAAAAAPTTAQVAVAPSQAVVRANLRAGRVR